MKKNINKNILNYNAVFTPEEEGGFSVMVPSLRGCYSQGETLAEAVKNIQEAIKLFLEDTDSRSLWKTPDPTVKETVMLYAHHTIKKGTLSGIMDQLNLSVEELKLLL